MSRSIFWPRSLRSLAHRNFRLFMGGQLVSVVGSWMQSVALGWLVYRLTGSGLLLGLIGFADKIPVFLLGAVGGLVADRFDRHRVVVITQTAGMIQALALGVVVVQGAPAVPALFILAALQGVINAFDLPARQSFISALVPAEDLPNALALNASVFNAARVIGPGIAGVLVALAGEAACFFSNALSYTAVLTGLLMMRIPARDRTALPASSMAQLREGMCFAVSNAPVRALLALLGVTSLCGVPCMVLMPIFAGQVFKGGPRELGLLMGASGVGAFVAAVLLAGRSTVRGLGRIVAMAAIGLGITLTLFAFSRSMLVSMALLVCIGFTMITQAAATNLLLQSLVPDSLRGRVMSLYTIMFVGMGPWGSLVAGGLAQAAGAPVAVALGGVACVAAGITFYIKLPALRKQVVWPDVDAAVRS